jgi:L-threonate 2-dehydrogenase
MTTAAWADVAVVGAGNMGGALVEHLCELGWCVAVSDVSEAAQSRASAAGARVLASARLAAQSLKPGAALVVAVVDGAQTRDVLMGPEGAAAAMHSGQAVLLCPTISPQDAEAMAQELAALGVDCLDAPMSGGPARARDGSMSLMLGGPADVLQRHQRLLDAMSSHQFVVGERVGDGARTKLVNNLLASINLVGAAEAIALAEHLGLDTRRTLDVIEQSSGQSWIGSDRMRRALAGDFAPRAHVSLLKKDSALAVAAARAAGYDGVLGPLAAQAFERAYAAGLGDLDDSALLLWLRNNA